MLRLRPLLWATFLPGSSTVPAALAVIFRTRSFSSLYTPWLLARPVDSLCRKSLRTLASFAVLRRKSWHHHAITEPVPIDLGVDPASASAALRNQGHQEARRRKK